MSLLTRTLSFFRIPYLILEPIPLKQSPALQSTSTSISIHLTIYPSRTTVIMSVCLANGCYKEKEGFRSGSYCKDHTCKESDCVDYAPSSSYCDEHGASARSDSSSEASEDITCEDTDCDEDPMSDSDYCYTHTCRWAEVGSVNCRQAALPDQEFCDEHADQLCEDCEEKPKQRRFSDWLGNYCHGCGEERATQKQEHRLQKRIDRVRDGEESPDEGFWEDLKHAKGNLDVEYPWDLDKH